MNGWTIQYIEKTIHGIRMTTEYECDSLEEAEQRAVAMTSDDPLLTKYDVAIIRRRDIVMARYFHSIQIP
jgi:hypothetical protein